jgi:hypothetical protein
MKLPETPGVVALTLTATPDPRVFLTQDRRTLSPPADWAHLPPGDAGLTRRVKAAGASWTIEEKVGRRVFSRGVWAPAAQIEAARAALELERATPAYQKKRVADVQRRERSQEAYAVEFEQAVRGFLRFAATYAGLERALSQAVTLHAIPVGSGTVARTERIPIERRAEAAVLAWMRHQTTAYDQTSIARVKGLRRQVRRDLSQVSRAVLDLHRQAGSHLRAGCPLCAALQVG